MNCKQGEDVTIVGSVSDEEAKRTNPQGWKAPTCLRRGDPRWRSACHRRLFEAKGQLGSARINGFFPLCADGPLEYWARCATVHRESLQTLLARLEAHGVFWACLGAEVQGPADRFALQWLALATQHAGLAAASRTALGPGSGSLEKRAASSGRRS